MVQEKNGVRLAAQEKGRLRKMIRAGRNSVQAITRARILLKIDEGWNAPQVAAALDVSERTVFRTKRRYAEDGLKESLRHHNQTHRHRKLDDRWRPISSPWPAARLPKAMTTGHCGCWRSGGGCAPGHTPAGWDRGRFRDR